MQDAVKFYESVYNLHGVLLCVLGEATLEPPSYYYTKPAVTPADPSTSTSHPPPDGAQRFSRRVRGIAAQNECSVTDEASDKLKADTTEPSSSQPGYRMITKRIRFRRRTLPKSSPWCRSSRPLYRKVFVYVDENGKELSALDMHKRTKAAIPQSTADQKKTENNVTRRLRTSSYPGNGARSKRLTLNTSASDESAAGSSSVVEVCNRSNCPKYN